MNLKTFLLAIALVAALLLGAEKSRAQGATFTYQGQLTANSSPANGNYDLTFSLFNTNSGGSQVGVTLTNLDVGVTNGLFTTSLNFGASVFSGASLWLGLEVRTNGNAAFTPLNPRQPLTPTPYAITAGNLTGSVPLAQLPGAVLTNGAASVNLTGSFFGNGGGLTNLPAAQLGNNVALLNASQTFSGSNIFSGAVTLTNLTNTFAGNGGGLTNVPGPTQTNYLFVYDTATQSLGTAGTFQQISFNTDAVNSSWIYTAGGSMIPEQSGLYLVQYTVNALNPATVNSTIDLEVRAMNVTTGIAIAGSQSIITIPPEFSVGLLAKSFLVSLSAGQTLALQFTANNTPANVEGGTLFGGDVFPGASLTIIRIQ